MKRLSFLFVVLLILTSLTAAQSKMMMKQIAEEKTVQEGKYLMDAHPLLERFNKANGIDFSKVPAPQNSLKKTNTDRFTLNQQKNWYAQNLVTNAFYSDPTTCRGIGKNCYVFVEDSSWTVHVNQNAVDQIINAFDNVTPADPTKGVYEMDVQTFGNPPDVDGDPKIIIVILNIRDGFSGSGGYTAGYFSAINEYPTSQYANSNVGEVYYMDCNPLDLETTGDLSTALQITAHEFQHMIEWNYHKITSNSDFFNEGCSMIAEVVCGYPIRLQSQFIGNTNVPTFTWNNSPPSDVLSDYGRAARFFLYVKEQLGVAALGKFVQSTLTDDNAFNVSVFPSIDPSRNFANFTIDWWVANYLNDKSVNSKYGYDYPGLRKVTASVIADPNVTNKNSSLYKQGVQYISYISGKNLSLTTNTKGNADIKFKAIEQGSGGNQVIDVAPNTTVSMPEFGTTYSTITLMAYHNNKSIFSNGPFSYTYNSTGEAVLSNKEIAYDTSEPTGVLTLSTGDSTAVFFDGIAGAKLDSIRVALRTLTPMTGGVWQAATSGSSFFGKPLVVPITATGITYVKGDYPSVWPNWAKVDLSNFNIDASAAFVVSFTIDGAYQPYNPTTDTYYPNGPNRVMITDYKSTSAYHSYFYDITSHSWVSYSDSTNPGYIFLNLIRAYVSFGGSTGVKETVELLPSTFKLDQNYPNPFNPSTIIRYELPKMSNVQVKIYDALGKEVRSLIEELQSAGLHNILWDGANNYGQRVSSGVYFYRIVAGDFVQTKKMILMK